MTFLQDFKQGKRPSPGQHYRCQGNRVQWDGDKCYWISVRNNIYTKAKRYDQIAIAIEWERGNMEEDY